MAARAMPAMAVTAIATEPLFQPDQKPTPRPLSTKARRWERPPLAVAAEQGDEKSMGRRRRSFADDGSRPSAITTAMGVLPHVPWETGKYTFFSFFFVFFLFRYQFNHTNAQKIKKTAFFLNFSKNRLHTF